jgi:hypothetical protein
MIKKIIETEVKSRHLTNIYMTSHFWDDTLAVDSKIRKKGYICRQRKGWEVNIQEWRAWGYTKHREMRKSEKNMEGADCISIWGALMVKQTTRLMMIIMMINLYWSVSDRSLIVNQIFIVKFMKHNYPIGDFATPKKSKKKTICLVYLLQT